MKDDYEVGYKRPPRQHQFKPKNQRTVRHGRGPQKEIVPDVAAWIDKPLKVKRQGKSIKMHPHEAATNALVKRALKGEPRATKQFLALCEQAGLFEPKSAQQFDSVFLVPRGVEPGVASVMLRTYGLPPWDKDQYAAVVEEYMNDKAHIERLYAKFLEDLKNERSN